MSTRVRTAVTVALVAIVLLALPEIRRIVEVPLFFLTFLYLLSFWITQATSWNLLSGYAGYFSFGQAAFYGTGVYTAAILGARYGVNFFVAVLAGGALGGVVALATGWIAFRLRSLRGEVFALLTLAVALLLAAVARATPLVDGGQGIAVPIADYPAFLGDIPTFNYRMGVLVAVVAMTTSAIVHRSRLGWGLFALRDQESVAEGLGIPTFAHKMTAFGLTGTLAGLGGAVHSQQVAYVTVEEVFGLTVPLLVILMAVLGGRQHWYGPALGATFIYVIQDWLISSGWERASQVVLGLVLVTVVLLTPEGLTDRLKAHPVISAVALVGVWLVQTLINRVTTITFADEPLDGLALGLLAAIAAALLAGDNTVTDATVPPSSSEPDLPTAELGRTEEVVR